MPIAELATTAEAAARVLRHAGPGPPRAPPPRAPPVHFTQLLLGWAQPEATRS